jgi:thiamine biosynthesis lipoprotein
MLLVESCSTEGELKKITRQRFQMGMLVELTVYVTDSIYGNRICSDAFERINELNLIFSDYHPDSELNRLSMNAGSGPVKVSTELFEVLAKAKKMASYTNGKFDPTVGPLTKIWRDAREKGDLPDKSELEKTQALIGYEKLILDPSRQTAELLTRGMILDLGGIAKGYIGDKIISFFKINEISICAYHAGGDMIFGDAPPDSDGWIINIPDAGIDSVSVSNSALSISGDVYQHLPHENKRYSHVIDIGSCMGLTNRVLCVVKSKKGMDADALSTIGTLVPEEEFFNLIQDLDNETEILKLTYL